ncbi:MAG: LysM peptidoglycan-binding domain-containing protein, partial [Gemmatimonadales bacterium]|nr:LysM peptidoglycan-binding domain-containing protein [Gemmatimonadales bacterium]
HVVRRGETLSSLARKYGVSVEALMSANGLRSARGLQAGRRLTIPG